MQRFVNGLFLPMHSMTNAALRVYIDDVIIGSRGDFQVHYNSLQKFFAIASANGIRLSANKTQLFTPNVKLLGFDLSHGALNITQSKKDTMRAMPRPTTAKEVERFIGVVNYLGRFITNCALHIRRFQTLRTALPSEYKWTTRQHMRLPFYTSQKQSIRLLS